MLRVGVRLRPTTALVTRSWRSLSSEPDTFLDSQSGLRLSRPQRGVLRLHELSSARAGGVSFASLATARVASADVSLSAALSGAAEGKAGDVFLFAPVSTAADAAAVRSKANGRIGASIIMRLPLSGPSMREGCDLVSSCSSNMRVRVVLESGFATGPEAAEDAVARFADAGAAVIVLAGASNGSNDDEDEVREAIERSFNLDVAGDALLERLAVRGSARTLAAALTAGVTRVDVDALEFGGACKASDALAAGTAAGLRVLTLCEKLVCPIENA